jgi:hypothetical protein
LRIDDERPTLIHTGQWDRYDAVRAAIREVLDGGSLTGIDLPASTTALREHDFAYRGLLLGREVGRVRSGA